MWDVVQAMGEAGRMLGMGMGATGQMVDYQQRAYGNYIPITATTTTGTALYIDDVEAGEVRLKVEEPPDEFTQLSNHKFHELLDRFSELI